MKHKLVSAAFSQNRAEELGHDVWNSFVVPPYFDQLMASHRTKPVVFIGGRGCGKTMLLRYLSHYSQFSTVRETIPESATKQVGLYWKVDTHFVQQLHSRGLPQETWSSAFAHILAIQIGKEILRALSTISASRFKELGDEILATWRCPEIKDFDSSLPCSHEDLLKELESSERKFISWVNNVKRIQEPIFLPGSQFITVLIDCVRALPCLSNSVFHIYIDEYENLREEQQRLINTALKHSTPKLVFNIAIKRNGIVTFSTIGEENISCPDDYRRFDLDDEIESTFDCFAAEVFFFRLLSAEEIAWVPKIVDSKMLQSVDELSDRREAKYREQLLAAIRGIFPGQSQAMIAANVMETPALRNWIKARVEWLLPEGSSITADNLLNVAIPEAAVILPALLARRRSRPKDIFEELKKLRDGEPNSFRSGPEWISNNLYAALLQVYTPNDRVCPLYAGFDAFVLLSHGNLRHFLELCHRSLNRLVADSNDPGPSVPETTQAACVKDASISFVREIKSFGIHGNRLHSFVNTLGGLFAKLLGRMALSEPEVSQFTIQGHESLQGLPADVDIFLREAVKWSVLFETRESKMKDSSAIPGFEWQLAPIYTPSFHISPRKKRKLELTIAELAGLIVGDMDIVDRLLKRYDDSGRPGFGGYGKTLFDDLPQDAAEGIEG
jgi:hypothetical protein